MPKLLVLISILALVVTGCGAPSATATLSAAADGAPSAGAPAAGALLVSGGGATKSYARADLEALPVAESTFKDVTYRGVTLAALLQDAGYDLAAIKAVKAVAADGFTANFDAAQVQQPDLIVAYARADGELTAEDGAFRIAVPASDGKSNVRMLAELQVIQ
jgi:hypothetical protein